MKVKILSLFVIAVLFASCSKDEDSTPVVQTPAYVGTYQGTNSQSKDVSFTISNIDGKAYVTNFSVTFTYLYGSSTATATKSQTDTKGIALVNNGTFSISLSADTNDKITGTFTSETNLTGAYSIDTGLTSGGAKLYGAGTFSIVKK